MKEKVIVLNPEIAERAHAVATEYAAAGSAVNTLIDRVDALKQQLWEILDEDPQVDTADKLYNYSIENDELTFIGRKAELGNDGARPDLEAMFKMLTDGEG